MSPFLFRKVMKPRILLVNEASFLTTGYSIYGRNFISNLHNSGYHVAELACYANPLDKNGRHQEAIAKTPWKIYPNCPYNEKEVQQYNGNPLNQWGHFRFNDVCIDFKPHVVVAIRDHWMDSFVLDSPFRRMFKFAWMPTIDGSPQKEEWLYDYQRSDAIFTYSDWSKDLVQEAAPTVRVVESTSPIAEKEFRPLENREEIKKKLGLDGVKIVGTVMRNQKRKLFPELFKAFRQYLDKTNRNDVVLYCHTSYPDNGWDIPKELLKYGLSSKVLFTYVCRETGHCFPAFFSDAVTVSPKTGKLSAGMTNVQIGVPNEAMNAIYNLFDLYVQYSVCEGFGMPQVEAAAAGVPVATVDYSAMSDVGRKLNAFLVRPKAFSQEMETDRNLALPDNDHLVEILTKYFSLPQAMQEKSRVEVRDRFEEHYSSWDNTLTKWKKYFDSLDVNDDLWRSQPRIHKPGPMPHQNISNSEFAHYIITNVLGERERLGTPVQSRLIKDITYGVTPQNMGGYFNEQSFSSRNTYKQFTREDAYNHFRNLCELRNVWESKRWQSLQR